MRSRTRNCLTPAPVKRASRIAQRNRFLSLLRIFSAIAQPFSAYGSIKSKCRFLSVVNLRATVASLALAS